MALISLLSMTSHVLFSFLLWFSFSLVTNTHCVEAASELVGLMLPRRNLWPLHLLLCQPQVCSHLLS
jgi:hypothetical protein